jgi:hypothetical protein
MLNKMTNILKKTIFIQNKGEKYSDLLQDFIHTFYDEFKDYKYYEDIISFAIEAWNIGNLKLILPENEVNKAINQVDSKGVNLELLQKMIDYKVDHFKDYTNFIIDFEIVETSGDTILNVMTQFENDFIAEMAEMAEMAEKVDSQRSDSEFEDNYIDRRAIILIPLQPFLDWGLRFNPDEYDEMKEIKTYLIGDDNEEVEVWVKKNFDKIFMFELDSWHPNKKEWPQNRNYKMFQEWFKVEISTLIYDFEKYPISKLS